MRGRGTSTYARAFSSIPACTCRYEDVCAHARACIFTHTQGRGVGGGSSGGGGAVTGATAPASSAAGCAREGVLGARGPPPAATQAHSFMCERVQSCQKRVSVVGARGPPAAAAQALDVECIDDCVCMYACVSVYVQVC